MGIGMALAEVTGVFMGRMLMPRLVCSLLCSAASTTDFVRTNWDSARDERALLIGGACDNTTLIP